ncbi:tRNA uridine-5-carboxymethylaminomethyl(34) synthesis GTPase MnmE [Ectothiorhodospiraceae bacterium WFHF3C12]|nr:tRNA uridine-5-carboxymethylaminomethyl(34) synthesis GTPase MnmE [Ectothiorhodospiraceae bacterium WFHF3C12]
MTPAADTICAIATPAGRGGIGVVRLSGPATASIARAVLGTPPRPRHAHYAGFRDARGEALDYGIALYFPAPHSFTGEDVLELQGHGGPVVLDALMARLTELGARPARPGEFSERAFLNGKLDLAQAEAIADLIDAGTAAGARAALHSLQGEFSESVHALVEMVTALRVYVEAAIDFPDEEIDFLADSDVGERLAAITDELRRVRHSARQGQLLRDGMNLAIAGVPNAGKSSLLNRLAGFDAAIVTDIAGTTRDTLRERIQIDGMPLHVVDTAGLRETEDVIEREGVRRARAAIESADAVLLVVDDARGLGAAERDILAELSAALPMTVVLNKIDLTGGEPGAATLDGRAAVRVSAATGAGLDALRGHLKALMGYTGEEHGIIARRRHLDALERAAGHLDAAAAQLGAGAGELLAEELRLAQDALGEITGRISSDELLGRIFSSFCIGK